MKINRKRARLQEQIDRIDQQIREGLSKKQNGRPEMNLAQLFAEQAKLHKEFAELKD